MSRSSIRSINFWSYFFLICLYLSASFSFVASSLAFSYWLRATFALSVSFRSSETMSSSTGYRLLTTVVFGAMLSFFLDSSACFMIACLCNSWFLFARPSFWSCCFYRSVTWGILSIHLAFFCSRGAAFS